MAKILVIDDDPGLRRALCAILRMDGHEPVEAADGHAGVDAIRGDHFALVITDFAMPDQDGIETIRKIRELAPRVPIIAMSGLGEGAFAPLEDAGMTDGIQLIGKPFDVHALRAGVRAHVT